MDRSELAIGGESITRRRALAAAAALGLPPI